MSKSARIAKQKAAAQAPPVEFVDGANVPSGLLGELRDAYAERQSAVQAVQEHNARGQQVQQRAVHADAVYQHFVMRVKEKCKVKDGDMIDLERGIVRVKVAPTPERVS